MTTYGTLDDPTMFDVWAHVDPTRLMQAAEHLARTFPHTVPQAYQIAKHAAKDHQRVQIAFNSFYCNELQMCELIPSGFVADSGVVCQDDATPTTSPFCATHRTHYARICGVCENTHLPHFERKGL